MLATEKQAFFGAFRVANNPSTENGPIVQMIQLRDLLYPLLDHEVEKYWNTRCSRYIGLTFVSTRSVSLVAMFDDSFRFELRHQTVEGSVL